MTEQQCKNCLHFLQHYTFNDHRLIRVYCGHCRFSRPKRKFPNSPACENYAPGRTPEDTFTSKEYLTKELLQYVLHLELLPKIEDGE